MELRERFAALLPNVTEPARYVGNEYNMIRKDPQSVALRYCFAFPDTYEVGMSHLGLRILYHMINERDDTYCERAFAPWIDMEKAMEREGLPLCSLETTTPLGEFDIIGFTLQYEMSYSNVLNMLKLAGIPLRSAQRTDAHPLIICGGPVACHAEPLAPFIDLFVIGDAEEAQGELLDALLASRARGEDRVAFLRQAAQISGIYVPSLYDFDYHQDGTIRSITPRDGAPAIVTRRLVQSLDTAYFPHCAMVPHHGIVHDRIVLEIMRGCTQGCRFCQAGMLYRPVRERSPETLLALAEELVNSTGYEEMSLSSLSTGDYSRIEELVRELTLRYKPKRVSVSLPSLRIDSMLKDVLDDISQIRKGGLTLAPEAGSQRLRDAINKRVTQEDLTRSVADAFASGWTGVKLYFMLGLPTETMEDVEKIAELAALVRETYFATPKEKRQKGLRITVSTAAFVPKPFTPFQWEPQDTFASLDEKRKILQTALRKCGAEYNWHEPRLSFLEGIFARGDRRLADVLQWAVEHGCHFDGWSDCFRYDVWMQAFEACGIDPTFYAYRQRPLDEILPWDHIDVGVVKPFLWEEWQKTLRTETTADCRNGCLGCGVDRLCDGRCKP